MRKKIIIIMAVFIILGVFWVTNKMKGFAGGQDKIFVIEKGQGVHAISKNLKLQGFIKNNFIFETFVWAKKVENKFQAGEYVLNTGDNLKKIVDILISGKVMAQEREIKIQEGWNINDIAEYLDNEGIFSKEEFLEEVTNDNSKKNKYEFLATIPDNRNIEGFLFPDTYRIYKSATANDVVNKMLAEFDKKFSYEMREDLRNQGKNPYDILIMASIIQKEVSKKEDMKMVSDIFWRRIDAGMPLQSCATIAYILGENKEQYTYEDIQIESEYNTYLNRGLPPSPICSPEFAAIDAAIYPEQNPYWYFLSKSENGETVFSKTLEEHNRNKAKYLK